MIFRCFFVDVFLRFFVLCRVEWHNGKVCLDCTGVDGLHMRVFCQDKLRSFLALFLSIFSPVAERHDLGGILDVFWSRFGSIFGDFHDNYEKKAIQRGSEKEA